jgi:hypothetical protein
MKKTLLLITTAVARGGMTRRIFGRALKVIPAIIIAPIIIALIGCVNPVVNTKKPIVKKSAISAETLSLVGTTTDNGDGTYSLEFSLPESSGGKASLADDRSLVNYESVEDPRFMADINYYQLVLVDEGNAFATPAERTGLLAKIWASVSAIRVEGSPDNGRLRVVVKPGNTYHILLLHGHKDTPADASEQPVLLGSGYIKYLVKTENNTVVIRMVPVLIDATIQKTGGTPWASVRNIAWVKDENFDVAIKLLSRAANQDGAGTDPHGNALWPLRLAEARNDPDVWEAFGTIASPQYSPTKTETGAGAWTGHYWTYDGTGGTPSVPADVSLAANEEQKGSVALYYSEGVDPTDAVYSKDASDVVGAKTNGTFAYTNFSTLRPYSQTTDYGKFSFGLTYIPFGIVDWSSATLGVQEAPQWKIGGDIYMAYRLYGRATGLEADTVGGKNSGAPGVPAGVSWATASKDLQYLADLASAMYAQDSSITKEIWVEAGIYTKAGGSGTVADISDGKNGVALYGGFKKPDNESNRLSALNTRPDRSGWFSSYPKELNQNGDIITPLLQIGNKYGTVADSSRKTTIDANGVDTAVKVADAANLVLDGFTITRGKQSGLWIENAPDSALFQNLEMANNEVTGIGGGGIYVKGGAPKLNKLTVTGNKSTGEWGGGIHLNDSAAIVTNALFSSNETNDAGGGIAIAGGAPRLENIIVTDNQSAGNGGGIYNHGNSTIINALVSGNTCDISASGWGAQGTGGALYTTVGDMTLVNALIAGNKSTVSRDPLDPNTHYYGGGGIKVNDSRLMLINSTVSGNYAAYDKPGNTDTQPGGGIMVVKTNNNGGVVVAYNSLVLGNTGTAGKRNDVATDNGGEFFAYNSLVGGWTKAETDDTATANGGIGNNADGMAYGTAGTAPLPATEAVRLVNLGMFFEKFPGIPNGGNTGRGKARDWIPSTIPGSAWDFHLNGNATDAINGGSASCLVTGFAGLPYQIAEDLDGDKRIRANFPDMGAYESSWTTLGVIRTP